MAGKTIVVVSTGLRENRGEAFLVPLEKVLDLNFF